MFVCVLETHFNEECILEKVSLRVTLKIISINTLENNVANTNVKLALSGGIRKHSL